MTDTLLQVSGLTMRFGGLLAVNNVSLELNRGEIVSLIGPNGAGKTRIFNCLTGFCKPAAGQILLRGKPVQGLSGQAIARLGMIRTFQHVRLFREMTVIENLLVAQHQHHKSGLLAGLLTLPSFRRDQREATERAVMWLDRIGLTALANRQAGNLAYGQQRRLESARAMCTTPEMICLDEPAAGLNPVETATLSRIIRFLRQHHGITVLLIEHDMGMVMEISDRVIVLDHGDVIAEGTPKEIQHNDTVIAAYLGADEEELAG